ncbi:MAG: SDR family NAD(P)-dependent oxidoreductase [Moraxellaceae bacterium]|nr:SDR family NAD(P)-dependent oxidoreductase [Moraxellaceae bacterium]
MSLNPRIQRWTDRHVWVIGASSGIGHALADALLQRGANVAVSARKTESLDALSTQYPGKVLVLPLDVSDADAWSRSYAALESQWPTLDDFIFCAADYQPIRAWELEGRRAEKMIRTNIAGPVHGVATVLPAMLKKQSGSIALIASVAGYMGLPKSLVYGPTKAALINFAEALYLDVHPRGIGVSIINPGFVDTPLTQGNDFTMPALITPAEAASEIIKGLEDGAFEIHFPKRFTRWLRLIRRLPYSLKFSILAEVAKKS